MKQKKDNSLTDELLIGHLKNDNEHAITILYNKYYKKVYHQCLTFVKNSETAFDLTHDILLKTIEKLDSFRGNSSFSTWLYAITHNHCIEYLRRKNQVTYVPLNQETELQHIYPDLDELVQMDNDTELRMNLLYHAEIPEKDLLLLKYRENMSIRDLQKRFNMSESAIKMRIARGKKKIAALYNT
jgi:RNA polymerase sigma factor (sigma-70 family)